MGLHMFRMGDEDATGLPFLMIHGWCCNGQAMAPVARAFPGRLSFLVDLPGHGASPPLEPLSIEGMAEAVMATAPPRFIAVGHSMGGQVALALAAMAPARVAGAVLLDPAHLLASDKVMEAGHAMRRNLLRHDPAEVVRAFAARQLCAPLEGEMAEAFAALVETMAATDPKVARAAWDAVLAWNGPGGAAEALAAAEVPLLALAIDKPVNRLSDLARASTRVMTGQVAGSGHMLQFEAMEQVAPMIRRWMALNGLEQAVSTG
ncbi:alpha/beta fold hydrolase [Thermaurantiacus sp.]